MEATLTQDWATVWYPNLIQKLIGISGVGVTDDDTGEQLPNLSATDLMAILGLVTPVLIASIERFAGQVNGKPKEAACRSELLQANGVLSTAQIPSSDTGVADALGLGAVGATRVFEDGTFIDAATYLSYSPLPFSQGLTSDTPWVRYPPGNPGDVITSLRPYSVFEWDTWYNNDQGKVLAVLREAIVDWQRMVMASASSLSTNSANVANPAPADQLTEFLAALRGLCTDFDTLNQTPPDIVSLDTYVHDAVAKASDFAGRAAADIANEVGKLAGIVASNAAGGLLSNIGVIGIILVAVVIKIYM